MQRFRFLSLGLAILLFASASHLHAQAAAAQSRGYTFSAFAGINGTFTGLNDTRNLSVTAGADMLFRPDRRLVPALEVRGTEVLKRGALVAEKNFLVGPRVSYRLGRLQPYANVLFGRGSLDFGANGVPDPKNPALVYDVTDGRVLGFGGGLLYDLTPSFAAKVDGQIQRYDTPVTPTGVVTGTSIIVGLSYTLNLGHRR